MYGLVISNRVSSRAYGLELQIYNIFPQMTSIMINVTMI